MAAIRRPKEIIGGLLWMASTPAKWKANTEEEKSAWYAENNIKHVVVLCNLMDEHLTSGRAGIDYWHAPLVDGMRLDLRIEGLIVPQVLMWMHDSEPTMVCCLVGRSRSGAAITMIVREYLGISGSDALDYVRIQRPNAVKRAGPEAQLRALAAPFTEAG